MGADWKMDGDKRKGYRSISRFTWMLGIGWTLLLVTSLVLGFIQEDREVREAARIQAVTSVRKDVFYRRWNAGYGGVYVPISEGTPPNPYLAHLPERDVSTTSGLELTLMNPAYMTRRVHEMLEKDERTVSRLVSLNPKNPVNVPDVWEREALEKIEGGVLQVNSVDDRNGEELMRLMLALPTEESCLKCHEDQGYRLGDIRGGISTSVPMEPLLAIRNRRMIWMVLGHLAIWLLGIVGLIYGSRRLLRSEMDREAARENLVEYAAQLEEANRHKDLFTDILRHDIVNPAGLIKNCSSLLLDKEEDREKKEFLEMIHRKSSRLIDLVEDASEYSKLDNLDRLDRRPENIGRFIEEALEGFTEEMEEEGIEVDCSVEGDCRASVNPLMGVVFNNLISNALKYSPRGGKVEIRLRCADGICLAEFKDNGEGIPDGDKERIFQRFERLGKKGIKGVGLGLAIARKIVDLHGGRIWVEDNPQGGSIFRVSLDKEE